jgi:hypothetical protein
MINAVTPESPADAITPMTRVGKWHGVTGVTEVKVIKNKLHESN